MALQVVIASKTSVDGFRGLKTADDVAAAFLAAFRSSTRQAYARDLRSWGSFLEGWGIEVLTAHRVHVDAYARECEAAGVSPSTLARRLSTMSGFYAYALDEDLIAKNPVARVRRPKVSDESPRQGLERDEAARLLATAEASGIRDHALACLLVLNGLRISEALALDVGDLSHERGHRTIALMGKGGKRATAPLAPRTAAAVDDLLGERAQGALFVTRTGRRLDRHAAWKIVRRLAREANIAKVISPHSLRHTACTLSLDAGAPLHRVQSLMRHADPRTTQRYNRHRDSLDNHSTYVLASFVA